MARRWIPRLVCGAASALLATVAVVVSGATLAIAGAGPPVPLASAAGAGVVVAFALATATGRYPAGLLHRARRVVVGLAFGVAAIGFAGHVGIGLAPAPLPLLGAAIGLLLVLPGLYDAGWRAVGSRRTLLAGDDPARFGDALAAIDPPPIGYCSPPVTEVVRSGRLLPGERRVQPDGGRVPVTGSPRLPSVGARRLPPADEQRPSVPSDSGSQPSGDAGSPAPDGAGSSPPDGDRSSPPDGAGSPPPGGAGSSPPGGAASGRPGWATAPSSDDADSAFSDALRPSTDASRSRSGDEPRSAGAVGARPSAPDASRVGGLIELGEAVRTHGVDTVALRFAATDREEFFGALRVCRANGVDALVYRSHAPRTLVSDWVGDEVARADLEPFSWRSRVVKRGFDLAFASIGILLLSPLMTAIAGAIKLDSPGPVLYGQRRTGRLGETFQLLKFRSMESDAEAGSGPRLSDEDVGEVDPRVTRVGRVLRATHMDELPQLFSVLAGEMSVVGPRPERPELEAEIATDLAWEQRWFLTPGLTGLAQVNDATGFQPRPKLEYDLMYRERQSFWLDVRIVATQIRQVLDDVIELFDRRER